MPDHDRAISDRLVDRPDLRSLIVNARADDEPVHRWFYLRESFRPAFVRQMLRELGPPVNGMLVDPFVGVGTSLGVGSSAGYATLGIDVFPAGLAVSGAKAIAWGADNISGLSERFASMASELQKHPPPPVADIAQDIQEYRDGLRQEKPAVERTKRGARERQAKQLSTAFADKETAAFLIGVARKARLLPDGVLGQLLLAAAIATAERSARTFRQGAWPRTVHNGRSHRVVPVQTALKGVLARMGDDLGSLPTTLMPRPLVVAGDSANLDTWTTLNPDVGAFICSPPYPNRVDYFSEYAVEASIATCGDADAVDRDRRTAIHSHHMTRSFPTRNAVAASPILARTLGRLGDSGAGRVEHLIARYHEDIFGVLQGLACTARANAWGCLVLANVVFAGVLVPVDAVVTELAAVLGFSTEHVWVVGYKDVSAQQRSRLSLLDLLFEVHPRVSVVVLRKVI